MTMTTMTTLSPSSYTSLGLGPLRLSAVGGGLAWQIADTQPSASSLGYGISLGAPDETIETLSQVWAIALTGLTPVQALTAPLTPRALWPRQRAQN